MPIEDPYAELGLAPTATADEVRAAYRRRARACHPDVSTAPGAAEAFARLQRAYAVLSDPERRAAWDRARRERASVPGLTFTWSNIASGSGTPRSDDEELGEAFDAMFGGG